MSGHIKIYTKTGDKGDTGLVGGSRVAKDSPLMSAIGDIDELNSLLGLVRAENSAAQKKADATLEDFLRAIQNDLFRLGADLSTPSTQKNLVERMGPTDATQLEHWIDMIDEKLDPLKNFILPGGNKTAALLHHARAVCRRTERGCVALKKANVVNEDIIIYLNRLSDLLFVLARFANVLGGEIEEKWQPRSS